MAVPFIGVVAATWRTLQPFGPTVVPAGGEAPMVRVSAAAPVAVTADEDVAGRTVEPDAPTPAEWDGTRPDAG